MDRSKEELFLMWILIKIEIMAKIASNTKTG